MDARRWILELSLRHTGGIGIGGGSEGNYDRATGEPNKGIGWGTFYGLRAPNRVTPAMWEQVEKIIRDPNESWFVKQWALGLLQHTDIEHLRTFRDLLVTLVQREEHWIQGSAISASQGLLSDPKSYKILFPPIVAAISSATEYPIVTRAYEITEELKDASREADKYVFNGKFEANQDLVGKWAMVNHDLLMEFDFDFERDQDYVPVYKAFVQVASR